MAEGTPEEKAQVDATDVVRAFTDLIVVVAVTVRRYGSDHALLLKNLRDPTQEMGEVVLVAETRAALALDGFLGGEQEFLLATLLEHLSEPLLGQLAAMHDQLHEG
jgi:hypothetical protein